LPWKNARLKAGILLASCLWQFFHHDARSLALVLSHRGALVFVSRAALCARACLYLAVLAAVGLTVILTLPDLALRYRNASKNVVCGIRAAVYTGGWRMFLERRSPDGASINMPTELARHVDGYKNHPALSSHHIFSNLVEHALWARRIFWLMWEIWRLGTAQSSRDEVHGFLDQTIRTLWPIFSSECIGSMPLW